MIDGGFYARHVFAALAAVYPVTNATLRRAAWHYPAEEYWPASLLTPRLRAPCLRSIAYTVSYGRSGGRVPEWSRRRQGEAKCAEQTAPTPCFVLKSTGFHHERDPGAAHAVQHARRTRTRCAGEACGLQLRPPTTPNPPVCVLRDCAKEIETRRAAGSA